MLLLGNILQPIHQECNLSIAQGGRMLTYPADHCPEALGTAACNSRPNETTRSSTNFRFSAFGQSPLRQLPQVLFNHLSNPTYESCCNACAIISYGSISIGHKLLFSSDLHCGRHSNETKHSNEVVAQFKMTKYKRTIKLKYIQIMPEESS